MEQPPGTSAGTFRPRTCAIHIVSNTNDDVRPFNSLTLEKCRQVLRVRSYNNLSYKDFILPSNINDEQKGFHYSCYKKFTALKKHYFDVTPKCVLSLPPNITLSEPPTRGTRSSAPPLLTKTIYKKVCVFCKKRRKMHNKKEQKLLKCVTDNFQTRILKAASVLNDCEMLALAELGSFAAKEFLYHAICDKIYRNKAAQKTAGISSTWKFCRERHDISFKYVCSIIEEDLLGQGKIFTTSELTKLYNLVLDDPFPIEGMENIKPSRLEKKILSRYQSKILVDKSKKDHILFKSSTNLTFNTIETKLKEQCADSALRNAAFELRKHVLATDKKPLPNSNLTVAHILEGECTIPTPLKQFVENVVYGPTPSHNNDSYNRRIESICSDIIFASTSGRTRPKKQLMLGCATKTLTGSKKVINILNKMGSSASYHTVEEIETELSYSSYNADSLVPNSIQKIPSLYTSVAFNNFDRFVETLTGKETLHDTVGIIFQNVCEAPSSFQASVPTNEQREENARKRRRFDVSTAEIEPYPKKPKLKIHTVFESPLSELDSFLPPNFRPLDITWMLNFVYSQPQTPMWTGFNSLHCIDESPQQKIAYLPQINHSPTSYAVVRHTLKQALQIAEECDQEQIMCTYDLNIAKMALEIQSEDKPMFDRVFIMLGPFHVEMAFFKALGKFIDGSGAIDILQESGVLAHGSVTGFVGGTNYNRCKRIHRLFALSLRTLHYERFKELSDSSHDDTIDDIPSLLVGAREVKVTHGKDCENLSPALRKHIEDYLDFEAKTLQGQHGKTPQIWITYIQLLDTYNDFVRSTRMGDINLFVKSINKIADIFFALNHPNYARWITPFLDNLVMSLNIEDHIGRQLRDGYFSIKRTGKSFSKTPIDLTLEQTINADAANKLTGVISSTNSVSARQRWAYSHTQRTQLVSEFMKQLGINAQEDVRTDLRPYRIHRDNQAYLNLRSTIAGMINPFDSEVNSNQLYNICTGKSAADEVYEFLTQIPQIGCDQHMQFREECNSDPLRFYKPLKRNKIVNFASQNVKITVSRSDKTAIIKMERNLMGRLLTIALRERIDLAAVLSFPLTPVPLSLGRPDGTLVKTQKSVLLKILEGTSRSSTVGSKIHDMPTKVDVTIVDGFYFMHLKGNSFSSTFGGIAHDILKKISAYKCNSVHLIFDQYPSPSIKDLERTARSGILHAPGANTYTILNPLQKRPSNFMKALRDTNFKLSLVSFLFGEWKKDEYEAYFKTVSLYLTVGESCYLYMSPMGKVVCQEVESFRCRHEEADSRMVYHLLNIIDGNVVINTCDTDVLIIILGNHHVMNSSVKIWMETGTFARNDHRFINIGNLAEHVGEQMCKSLPGFHAFTGSDYTSSFFRIGKNKPYNILKNHPKFQDLFAAFGGGSQLGDSEFDLLEEFVCRMYSRKEIRKVDELRLHMFMDVYSKKSIEEPFKSIKGVDHMTLPPCKKTLRCHALRSKYVTKLWTNVQSPNPPSYLPEDFGWELTNNKYQISWFVGPALPTKLEEIITSEKSASSEDEPSESEAFSSSESEEEDE